MTKALVIDDSSTVRSIISKMLTSVGIESVQAGNGQEALTMLAGTTGVTVAFVDWNMPIMSGIEFVRQTRKQEKYNSVKLIMVTTETEMQQVQLALECGVDEYIMKPFTKEMFEEKLSMLGIVTASQQAPT